MFRKYFRSIFLFLSLLLCDCNGAQQQVMPAPKVDPNQSIIFHNGVVLTMDADRPIAEAVSIKGEKIEAVGTNVEILALQSIGTEAIDLEGRTLMPGFVDAHTHILNDARSQGRSLDQAQTLALRNGITTLGDLYVDESFTREIQAFALRGELRVRTNLYLVANTNCGINLGDWYMKYPPTRQPGEMLRVGGVKIFTDGGSCGGVALSFELEPGQGQGDLWLTQDRLNEMVAEAQAAGYQVAIHAIGDRAVAQAQDAIAFALDGSPNIYRHRMEHLSVLRPEFISRFGELGIVPVLNGEYPVCTPFGPAIPEGYRDWEWPWLELRSANPDLQIAWHSDYPFLSGNPFVHLYGFVTRNGVFQNYTCPAKDWLIDDTLTVLESLSIMTIESAYALFRDEEVGSLETGKYADMIVISGNPLTKSEDELKSLDVLVAMVGGSFEYCNPRNPDLCPTYQVRTPLPLPDFRPAVPIRWVTLLGVIVLPLIVGLLRWRMPGRRWLARLGGVSAIVGGALWIWVWAIRIGDFDTYGLLNWLLIGASTLLAIAAVGLTYTIRPSRLSELGLAMVSLGLVAVAVGQILTSWFRWEDAWLFLIFGLLGHAFGLIIFGLANLRARRMLLINLLPLIIALAGILLPLILSTVAGESNLPVIAMGYGLGIGWIVNGVLHGLIS